MPVNQTTYQKYLCMFLDNKLNFSEHLKYITNKVNKSIGLLRKLTCKVSSLIPSNIFID